MTRRAGHHCTAPTRAFAHVLPHRWDTRDDKAKAADKAAADKAAADKAAADKVAAEKRAADKAAAEAEAAKETWNSHKPTFYFLTRAAVLGATAKQLKRMQELRDSKLLEKMAIDLNDAFQGKGLIQNILALHPRAHDCARSPLPTGKGLIQNILFVSHRWEDWATPDETALHACAHDGALSSPLPTGGRTGRRPMRPARSWRRSRRT